ncbi:hypothetical protein CHCC20335_2826 [Bacillus paralicheniformis]|nr:hypothetical protein CHCC20335_2826 [Bacillus paralicheniformis]
MTGATHIYFILAALLVVETYYVRTAQCVLKLYHLKFTTN